MLEQTDVEPGPQNRTLVQLTTFLSTFWMLPTFFILCESIPPPLNQIF